MSEIEKESEDVREVEEVVLERVAIAIMEAVPEKDLESLQALLAHEDSSELEAFLKTHVPHYEHVIARSIAPLKEELLRAFED